MRIAVVYDDPGPDAAPEDADVLAQRDSVSRALGCLGHEAISVPCTMDLAALAHSLRTGGFDCAFNLVESLGGTDRLAPIVPLLLDAMGLAYTGSSTSAMLETADKPSVKARLKALGLPTPDSFDPDAGTAFLPGLFIVKPRFEHSSFGMDDGAVVQADTMAALQCRLIERAKTSGCPVFAERFIDGREFNVSLLADAAGVEVLAPAEIDFSAFPSGKPHIVGYSAKWESDSFEYCATPRRFAFAPVDEPLLALLRDFSRRVWQVFNLRGYARVDYRVDRQGQPCILEVNTNPCLSPDAGFPAAAARSGYTFAAVVERILAHAVARSV